MCHNGGVRNPHREGAIHNGHYNTRNRSRQVSFQLHGVDAQGVIVLQKKLRRGAVVKFLSKLEPCLIGIEACATSHYWAREIAALGHDVKMIPPAYVIHMSNAKRMMPQMRKPSARPPRAQTCAWCQGRLKNNRLSWCCTGPAIC